ncbi:uncharacterized protein LOC109824068 [Asparagus officinalis]|uniref:uncharacterized protein LOC109824068 n=1 Tax=Asparagus officinalis TaxID=4686 RepID=UPI00098E3EA4|nr:uncharacterized protein LOC109824068 [Asparagus officinalis]
MSIIHRLPFSAEAKALQRFAKLSISSEFPLSSPQFLEFGYSESFKRQEFKYSNNSCIGCDFFPKLGQGLSEIGLASSLHLALVLVSIDILLGWICLFFGNISKFIGDSDVLAMIANAKPMIKYVTRYNKADTRRDIIIVDKDEITLSVTLFGDLAGNEGSIIEGNMHETTIIALSNFKISQRGDVHDFTNCIDNMYQP